MNFDKHLKVLYNTVLSRANETHRHVITAIIMRLASLETDLGLMLLELCITSATGQWLDEWGSWFGVPRRRDEIDPKYGERIIISVKSPKTTIPAIKDHAAIYLNYLYSDEGLNKYSAEDINVFEPWTKLAVFSQRGTLSGSHLFPDGTYWRRNVIDVSIPEDITKDFIDLIDQIKAAGIRPFYSVSPMRYVVVSSYSPDAHAISDMKMAVNTTVPRVGEGSRFSVKAYHTGVLSGRRVVWSENFCEMLLMARDALNWWSPITTIDDVLLKYGETTVEAAYTGLPYSYPQM